MEKSEQIKAKILPFTLTAGIIFFDQLSKFIVSRVLPYMRPVEVLGDFFRLTYVTNTTIAFSIGRGLGQTARTILVLILPVLVMAFLVYYFFFSKDVTRGQRWILAAILGGGLGNYLDRLFRSRGVIDFLDLKFYGIFGLERWPVFNLADSSVVVAGITLVVYFFVNGVKKKQ